MSRIVSILVLLGMVLATALASAAAAARGVEARPSLRILDSQPLTLAGRAFKSEERVRVVVVRGEETRSRVLRANPAGRFVATFSQLGLGRCAAFFVRASGDRGSRAVLKLAQPACIVDRATGAAA